MIEQAIKSAIKEALNESRSDKPSFMTKERLAHELGYESTRDIDRLIKDGVLREHVHFTRFTDKSRLRFYWRQVEHDLKPQLSKGA